MYANPDDAIEMALPTIQVLMMVRHADKHVLKASRMAWEKEEVRSQ